jgi:hypothetical protein
MFHASADRTCADECDNEVVSSDDRKSGSEIESIVDELDELRGLCEQLLAGEGSDTENETAIDHASSGVERCEWVIYVY